MAGNNLKGAPTLVPFLVINGQEQREGPLYQSGCLLFQQCVAISSLILLFLKLALIKVFCCFFVLYEHISLIFSA